MLLKPQVNCLMPGYCLKISNWHDFIYVRQQTKGLNFVYNMFYDDLRKIIQLLNPISKKIAISAELPPPTNKLVPILVT